MLISVILKQVRKLFCQSHHFDNDRVLAYPLQSSLAVNSPKGNFPSGGGDIVIIERERERLKDVGKEGESREGVCMVALEMFSHSEHLRTFVTFVSICLGNGLPAAEFGNTQGALQQQRGWWGVNLLRVK